MKRDVCLILTMAFTVSCLSGCARSAIARHNALLLQNQLGIYQIQVNAKIVSQQTYYKSQSALIDNAKQGSFVTDVDMRRRSKARAFADELSTDPSANVRMSNLEKYLIDSNESEYTYYQELRDSRRQAAADLSASLSELESQTKTVEQVKETLGQLGSPSKTRGKQVVDSAEGLLTALPTK